jgi:hypothetical protein
MGFYTILNKVVIEASTNYFKAENAYLANKKAALANGASLVLAKRAFGETEFTTITKIENNKLVGSF